MRCNIPTEKQGSIGYLPGGEEVKPSLSRTSFLTCSQIRAEHLNRVKSLIQSCSSFDSQVLRCADKCVSILTCQRLSTKSDISLTLWFSWVFFTVGNFWCSNSTSLWIPSRLDCITWTCGGVKQRIIKHALKCYLHSTGKYKQVVTTYNFLQVCIQYRGCRCRATFCIQLVGFFRSSRWTVNGRHINNSTA